MESKFPPLPIIRPEPPPRSASQKYGGLYILGLGGLIVLGGLLSWFGISFWSMRSVFRDIYILHDAGRPEVERVQAAYALSQDARVTQRQYWDILLRKPLPDVARYLLAESLTAEAVADDPRGYVIAVAYSKGWPNWLRLQALRPLAYAADQGYEFPQEALSGLRQHPDPVIRLWATYIACAQASGNRKVDNEARQFLKKAADQDGDNRDLAVLLIAALESDGSERTKFLDRASQWIRTHHPESARIWEKWEIEGNTIRPRKPIVPTP
jgi:hypothetical protein